MRMGTRRRGTCMGRTCRIQMWRSRKWKWRNAVGRLFALLLLLKASPLPVSRLRWHFAYQHPSAVHIRGDERAHTYLDEYFCEFLFFPAYSHPSPCPAPLVQGEIAVAGPRRGGSSNGVGGSEQGVRRRQIGRWLGRGLSEGSRVLTPALGLPRISKAGTEIYIPP